MNSVRMKTAVNIVWVLSYKTMHIMRIKKALCLNLRLRWYLFFMIIMQAIVRPKQRQIDRQCRPIRLE